MHDCLLLPDVFHRILDFVELELPVDFYASHTQLWWKNRSLARLARTCRAFQEPSLNVLWKRQYTLGPLVRTLPEDAWEEEVISFPEPYNQPDRKCHHLTIKRPLSLSDWRRFDYYARRIQSLGYLDFEFADQEGLSWAFPNLTVCDRPIGVTHISRLALYRRNRWLLPNLVHLRWTVDDSHFTEYMPLFLGPHLKTLAIGFGHDCVWGNPNAYTPDVLCSVLEALPYNCPSLTELEIYPRHHFSVLQAAAELSMAYDDIEGYYVKAPYCGAMQDDFVDDLSKKRRLRKVWLGLDADTVASVSSLWAANPYPFSSLSILGIDVPRLGLCTAFMKLLRHCRLFSLAVEIHHPPRATELYDFFDTLRLCCSRETLHVFTLDQHDIHQHCEDPDCESNASDSDHHVGLAEMEPVLHFPHLRLFILHVPMFGNFFDEDIVRIADAWPGLINFRLMNARKLASQSPITWKGVGYMVTRCPQLTDIRLTFDTASNNVDEIVRLPGFRPNHWLRFFDVLESTLSDNAEHFARSLVAIAPRVVLVEASGWTEGPDDPLPVDPYAFCEQLEIIMCRLRKMYMSDIYDLDEIGDEIVNHTNEWSAWG